MKPLYLYLAALCVLTLLIGVAALVVAAPTLKAHLHDGARSHVAAQRPQPPPQ